MINLFSFFFFFLTSKAQVPSNEQTMSATQIVVALGIDKKIEKSLEEGDLYFVRSRTYKNNKVAALEAEISTRAKAKYENEKQKIKSEVLAKITSELNNSFTDTEKKYLIDISKYAVIKKLIAFLDSGEYQLSTNLPMDRAMSLMRDARAEVKKEEIKTTTQPRPLIKN